MSKNKIVYQNWITEIGYDPGNLTLFDAHTLFSAINPLEENKQNSSEEIQMAVRKSIETLKEEEKEFIIHFYFMGESYNEISEKTGRAVYKLAALHLRALKKLKRKLALFVKERFRIELETYKNCPICESLFLRDINELIKNRDKSRTWKPVMDVLKKKYNIKITTPQIIIGHEKYHISNNVIM